MEYRNSNKANRGKDEKIIWQQARISTVKDDHYIMSVPMVGPNLIGKSKTLYIFHGEKGYSSFSLTHKPTDSYMESNGLYLDEDFSGELAITNSTGRMTASSVLSDGRAQSSFRAEKSSPLSTLRNMGLEDDLIILDEVIIEGTQIYQNTTWVWLSTGSNYWDISGQFPGSVYDGYYDNQYNYLIPISTSSSSGTYNIVYETSGHPLVDIDKVTDCFSDGKAASNYKMTIYVDQPVSGSRDPHAGPITKIDVGHTFIGLKKTNTNGSVVERIVGYYPKTGNVNPIINDHTDTGAFRNNGSTDYDVSVIFEDLSLMEWNNILNVLNNLKTSTYNLNTNNCSDVGLACIDQTSLNVADTQGNWFNGGGTNPGDLGEDIRSLSSTSTYTVNKTGGTTPSSLGGC